MYLNASFPSLLQNSFHRSTRSYRVWRLRRKELPLCPVSFLSLLSLECWCSGGRTGCH